MSSLSQATFYFTFTEIVKLCIVFHLKDRSTAILGSLTGEVSSTIFLVF